MVHDSTAPATTSVATERFGMLRTPIASILWVGPLNFLERERERDFIRKQSQEGFGEAFSHSLSFAYLLSARVVGARESSSTPTSKLSDAGAPAVLAPSPDAVMLADARAPAVLADVLAAVMLALPAPRLRCARSLPLPLPACLLLHRIVVLLLLRRSAVSDRIATLAALAPLPRARIDPSLSLRPSPPPPNLGS